MPPILITQNISKRFGANPLFDNLSFAVHDGDRIGLIGPNGAGKSTLLAILGAEQETDSGEVSFRKRARIGYVQQISDFAPGITVREVAGSRPRPRRPRRQPSTNSDCTKLSAAPAS